MLTIPLKCDCETVVGTASLKSSGAGNHVVCFCEDCQSFARYFSGRHDILDEWGGTDIYQVAPWNIEFHSGIDQLRCLRLTPKGLYRWYTGCCSTPVGNTVSARLPFIGLIHTIIDEGHQPGSLLGPVRGFHKLESALGNVPESVRKKGMPLSTLLRLFWRIFKWKVTAGNKPNPLFDNDGKCISKPTVLKTGAG